MRTSTSSYDQISCTSGCEYDFSIADYQSILTQYNWVCDKSHWSTWVHTATNGGRAAGTLLLGYLADKYEVMKSFFGHCNALVLRSLPDTTKNLK